MLAIKIKNMNYFSRRNSQKIELEKYAQLGKISHELFHDILNPISGLILYFEILNNNSNIGTKIESSIYNEIKELSDSGIKIRKFIRMIQDNLLDPEKETILDTNKEIKEVISLIYPKAKRNSVSIYFIQEGEINLKFSKIKFYQLVINLISNGIDSFENIYDTRKRRINIKCRQEDEKIYLNFTDNGCGIENKYLKKIFKDNYTNKEKGFGIGLKTVKKIINESTGKIFVKSEINKGTNFNIIIPNNH